MKTTSIFQAETKDSPQSFVFLVLGFGFGFGSLWEENKQTKDRATNMDSRFKIARQTVARHLESWTQVHKS